MPIGAGPGDGEIIEREKIGAFGQHRKFKTGKFGVFRGHDALLYSAAHIGFDNNQVDPGENAHFKRDAYSVLAIPVPGESLARTARVRVYGIHAAVLVPDVHKAAPAMRNSLYRVAIVEQGAGVVENCLLGAGVFRIGLAGTGVSFEVSLANKCPNRRDLSMLSRWDWLTNQATFLL